MRKSLFTLACVVFIFVSSPAQSSGGGARYADAVQRARTLILDSLKASRIPGVSVSVSVNGTTVWSEGFGFADLEQQVPVTPETRFRIGSVSKPLTAAALALLYEEGKVNLDTLIQASVPDFPPKQYPITLRQLAGHIAGIRHYRGSEMMLSRRYETVAEGLEIFRDDSLLFEPGSRFSYSSYAWNLISAAIEGASGRDFLSFMADRVFRPLGMSRTIADYSDSLISGRARWYTANQGGPIVNAPFVDNSYKWAGGGFLSTTDDLLKFANALLEDRLLKPATKEMMFTPQRLNNGDSTAYGIGWFIRTDSRGRRVVSHSGGSVGGTANLLLYPDHGLVVALLVNSDRRFIHNAYAIAEIFLPQ